MEIESSVAYDTDEHKAQFGWVGAVVGFVVVEDKPVVGHGMAGGRVLVAYEVDVLLE